MHIRRLDHTPERLISATCERCQNKPETARFSLRNVDAILSSVEGERSSVRSLVLALSASPEKLLVLSLVDHATPDWPISD